MQEAHSNTLPPKMSPINNYGSLQITPLSLSFFKTASQNHLLKITFWGSKIPHYVSLNSTLSLQIVASIIPFKQYLIDSKVMQLQIVDNRNYKPIATTYLNWLPYLRSITDNEPIHKIAKDNQDHIKGANTYFLPFFDEQMEASLDLYCIGNNYRLKYNEKIGELKIRWSSKIFNIQGNNAQSKSRVNSGSNLWNIRGSQLGNKKSDINPVSICEIQLNEQGSIPHMKTNNSIIGHNLNAKMQGSENQIKKSILSNRENVKDNLRGLKKVREEDLLSEIQRPTKINTNKNNSLDTELMRIRLEMEQFGRVPEKDQLFTIQINYLEVPDRQTNIKSLAYIDVAVQKKNNINKYRLYIKEIVGNKAIFNSCLGIQKGSKLNVSTTIRKHKQRLIKGELQLNFIADQYDINLYSSEGVIEGILRFKSMHLHHNVVQKQGTNKVEQKQKQYRQNLQQLKNDKKSDLKVNINKKQIPVQIASKDNQIINHDIQKQIKEQQNLFFVVYFNQINCSQHLSYKVFDKQVRQNVKNKFILIPYEQIKSKQIIVNIYKNNILSHEQKFQETIKQIILVKYNLTCTLLVERYIGKFNILCQIYSGSLQQIAYFVQQISNSSTSHNSQTTPYVPQGIHKYTQGTHKYVLNKEDTQNEKQQIQNLKRKLKTEQKIGRQAKQRIMTEGRVSAESISAHQLQIHQDEQQAVQSIDQPLQNQNIYLVDLMTRFLSGISVSHLPEEKSISKKEFLDLISKKQQQLALPIELLQLISSIFQQQEESLINIEQIKQSAKALYTFSNLYREEKQKLLTDIISKQPKALQRIKTNAQLGMINESILWGRALSKISNTTTRQRINKFYRISSYSPTDAQYLIQDLQKTQTIALRELDISNIGILVRESVQKYLEQRTMVALQLIRRKIQQNCNQNNWINIRGINIVFEEQMSLKISLWESLMLIQEIKVSYGCDLDAEQGIISSDSLLAWIDSVENRHLKYKDNNSSSRNSLDQDQMALFQRINNRQIEQNVFAKQEVVAKSKVQGSFARMADNDSQITDIALLLNKRQEQLQSKSEFNKKNYYQQNESKVNKNISNKNGQIYMKNVLKQQTNRKDIQNSNYVQQNKSQKIIQRQQKQNIFYLQIKKIKLYQRLTKKRIKVILGVQSVNKTYNEPSNNFFYIQQQQQQDYTNEDIFQLQIKANQRSSLFFKMYEGNNLVGSSFIPWQQYSQSLKNKKDCKKTAVIYKKDASIVGKIIINLINKLSQQMRCIQIVGKKQILNIKIQNIQSNVTIGDIYIKVNEDEQKSIKILQNIKIQLSKPVYHSKIQIFNQSRQYFCSISLEQLFIKQKLVADYPLIRIASGTFAGNLKIAMKIQNSRNQLLTQKSSEEEQQKIKTQQSTKQESMLYIIKQLLFIQLQAVKSYQLRLQCVLISKQNQNNKQQQILISSIYKFDKRQMLERIYLKNQLCQIDMQNQNNLIRFRLIDDQQQKIAQSQEIRCNTITYSFNDIFLSLYSTKRRSQFFCLVFKKIIIYPFTKLNNNVYKRLCVFQSQNKQKQLERKIKEINQQQKLAEETTIKISQKLFKNVDFSKNNTTVIFNNKVISINIKQIRDLQYIKFQKSEQTIMQLLQSDEKDDERLRQRIQYKNMIKIFYKNNSNIAKQLQKILSFVYQQRLSNQNSQMGYGWILAILMNNKQYKTNIKQASNKLVFNQINQIYKDLKNRFGQS